MSGLLLSLALLAAPAAAQLPAPPAAVAPLGPRTVVPATVVCTNVPTDDVPSPAYSILAPHVGDGREFSYQDGLVVLSGGTPQGLTAGARYFTRRYTPPPTGQAVGEPTRGSIRTTGWLTIVAADEHSALGRIDYACTGVASGDYLEPFVEPALPAGIAPDGLTDFNSLGRVLFGMDRRESFGAGDLLSIDRGTAQGMAVGTRIGFYRDRRNGTPLVELGSGVVVEVSEQTAKVVVERARFPVALGDYFGVRKP